MMGGGGGGGDDVYLNPSILRLKQICTVYHLCEMASVTETKDMLFQRLRERLLEQDLELTDLRDIGEDALFIFLGTLGFNPVDSVRVQSVLKKNFASSDVAASPRHHASEVGCVPAPQRLVADATNCATPLPPAKGPPSQGPTPPPPAPSQFAKAEDIPNDQVLPAVNPADLAHECVPCPKQPAFKVHKGRRKETKELFLATKLVIVRHAVSSGLLEDSQTYKKLTPCQFMDFSALGDNVEKRKVCTVRKWALQSVQEGWEKLAANDGMQTRYGPNPLAQMRRVPHEWCREFGVFSKRSLDDQGCKVIRKRGRTSIMEKHPQQLLACQGRLVQILDGARGRGIPVTCSTLFHTWNEIVKRYNREQSLIGAETLKSRRFDGTFSYSWVRDMCVNLGLKTLLQLRPSDPYFYAKTMH